MEVYRTFWKCRQNMSFCNILTTLPRWSRENVVTSLSRMTFIFVKSLPLTISLGAKFPLGFDLHLTQNNAIKKPNFILMFLKHQNNVCFLLGLIPWWFRKLNILSLYEQDSVEYNFSGLSTVYNIITSPHFNKQVEVRRIWVLK